MGIHERRERTEDERARGVIGASPAYLVVVVLFNLRLLATTLSLIGVILRRFFIDQYKAKHWPGDVPVKNIEHPLDASIPIRYEAADVYLTFVKLWISALSYLRRSIGPAFNGDIVEFLNGLSRCYSDASSVYGRCRTTTRRPERAPCRKLAFVYAVDPHLYCIPSLHVLVVCYTYRRLYDLVSAKGAEGEYAVELGALRDRAARITESILYVRQHSVNCIPTALSMLSVIVPSYDGDEARSFLALLFDGEGGIDPKDRKAALEYMVSLYDSLASAEPAERYDAILDFVLNYKEILSEEGAVA